MAKDVISFIVPVEYNSLIRTSEMLRNLAGDLPGVGIVTETAATVTETAATVTETAATVTETAATVTETGPTPPNSIELDDAGLPWDHRIHSSSKKKTVKEGKWKLMRGVSPDLVVRVEAELQQAMSIPAGGPEPDAATDTAAAPGPDAAAAFGTGEAEPPDKTLNGVVTPHITNFAELNQAITAAPHINLEMVNAAVRKVGLASYPLLAARPCLLPKVVAELFPGRV